MRRPFVSLGFGEQIRHARRLGRRVGASEGLAVRVVLLIVAMAITLGACSDEERPAATTEAPSIAAGTESAAKAPPTTTPATPATAAPNRSAEELQAIAETVEALVDSWGAAWVANNPNGVAGAFTETGVYRGRFDGIDRVGRAEIAAHVTEIGDAGFTPTLFERTGDAVHEDGSFAVPVRYTYRETTFNESLIVQLDGGLFTTVKWRR